MKTLIADIFNCVLTFAAVMYTIEYVGGFWGYFLAVFIFALSWLIAEATHAPAMPDPTKVHVQRGLPFKDKQ